jgi:hypothetical protein
MREREILGSGAPMKMATLAFLLGLLLVISIAGCASAPTRVAISTSGVALTTCTSSGNEYQASGTLFNDQDMTADYLIMVKFFQRGRLLGTANDNGVVLNTHNERPFAHDRWFATLKPAPPGPVVCKLGSIGRTDGSRPSGQLTHPNSDISLSRCQNSATGPYVRITVNNKHDSTGDYTVNVTFSQNGKTVDTMTSDSDLDSIDAYDQESENLVATIPTPSPGPVGCTLAGVYRWSA